MGAFPFGFPSDKRRRRFFFPFLFRARRTCAEIAVSGPSSKAFGQQVNDLCIKADAFDFGG
jgi:hypothetical protein